MVVKTAKANELFNVLPDSGAELSLISAELVRKLRLHVFPPRGLKYIKVADKRHVLRNGFVKLPVTVMFPETNRKPEVFVQQFEVFDMEPHFIFGTDVLPTLFPRDSFTSYMIPHSEITETPVALDVNSENFGSEYAVKALKTVDPTFRLTSTPNASGEQMSHKDKLDFDVLTSYDHVARDVESAIEDELKLIQEQMRAATSSNSADETFELNKTELKEFCREKTLAAMKEYFETHGIPVTGPWKSTSGKRIRRQAHRSICAKVMQAVIREDVLSLSQQVSDIGVGNLPPEEVPSRPVTSTPATVGAEH
ncbi:MAG TPA: retropepsin-like aspartic protease, partial [Phormidium sp.]